MSLIRVTRTGSCSVRQNSNPAVFWDACSLPFSSNFWHIVQGRATLGACKCAEGWYHRSCSPWRATQISQALDIAKLSAPTLPKLHPKSQNKPKCYFLKIVLHQTNDFSKAQQIEYWRKINENKTWRKINENKIGPGRRPKCKKLPSLW